MNTELITSVDLSKASVRTVADQLIELAETGNPLEVKLKLKAMQEAIAEACKKVDAMARDEAEKYGSKSFDYLGCNVSLIEAGTSYDYSNCGDIELEQMLAEQSALEARIKARKEIVKNIKGKMILVNESTGESYEVVPPIKSSISTIKITLK